MIQYPFMKVRPATRQVTDTFRGYNHNLKIGNGEFYEMENLTSDDYPVLSTRRKRGAVRSLQDGGDSTGAIYIPGVGIFVSMDQKEQGENTIIGALHLLTPEGELIQVVDSLATGKKTFALMGDRLIVAPDMVWVEIHSSYESYFYLAHGNMSYSLEVTEGLMHSRLCQEDGSNYDHLVSSSVAPDSPVDMMVWVDTSAYPYAAWQYSAVQEQWVALQSTYIRIWSDGNPFSEHHFYAGDGITISGLEGDMRFLNGSHIVKNVGHGYIVVAGVTDRFRSMSVTSPVRFERKVPVLDFVVESGNRIWGCAKDTNEIYACKQGDYHNWNCFQGLSTDSWVSTVGTPGAFTGAAVQNGYPVFYKEKYKHKVWPSATGAHQVTAIECNGVENGSESSIAVLDGTVFYKSPFGICADDGGGTVEIGRQLGDVRYIKAVGAIYHRKYYLYMEDSDGKGHLFVYDIDRKLWHREDSPVLLHLISGGDGIYTASEGEMWDLSGKTGTPEDDVSWMAVTGDLGLELPEHKYITRLTLRLSLDPGATLEVYAQYDREQTWVKLGQAYGTDLQSFSLPVRPRRCDQLRLKLQGTGMCKLYSITKTLEKGSELP